VLLLCPWQATARPSAGGCAVDSLGWDLLVVRGAEPLLRRGLSACRIHQLAKGLSNGDMQQVESQATASGRRALF